MRNRVLAVFGLVAIAAAQGCGSSRAGKPVIEHQAKFTPNAPGTPMPTTTPGTPAPDAIKLTQIREKALQVLEESANSPDGEVRGYACEGASLVPSRLGGILLKGLDDPTPGVKAMAATASGQARYLPAAPKVHSLTSDPSPFVRISAIYALSRLGKPVDLSPLASYLTGSETLKVRSQSAWVIGEIGNRSAIPMLRAAAVENIARSRPLEIMIFQLQCGEARVKLGDNEPIEGIRAALFPARPEDFETAVLAVQIIGEVKDNRSMDQLMYLSEYRDARGNPMPPEFRLACATAIAKLGLDRGSFLADEYAKDPNPLIRQQAASVYGYTARPEHFLALEALMNDPAPMVRVVAASSVIRAHARLTGEKLR